MDLVSVFNPGRICYVGDRVHFVRALSLSGLATILAWLDDVIPGKPDRLMPPALGSDEAQAALTSPAGKLLLTWLALRDSGLSYMDCAALELTDVEHYVILDRLFAVRRTAAPGPPDGSDVANTWAGENMAAMAAELGLEALGRLSRDQFEWLMSSGNVDSHCDPHANGYRDAMAQYNAAMARQAEADIVAGAADAAEESARFDALMAAAEAEMSANG